MAAQRYPDDFDGIIAGALANRLRSCSFDFSKLACKGADGDSCLTPPQLETVEPYYGGTKNSKGELITPENTVLYYESVPGKMKGTRATSCGCLWCQAWRTAAAATGRTLSTRSARWSRGAKNT
ncbi:MAG TPA: hypothetical protein VFO31_08740 [Vicinamibacterales bacterium]|nr:hypothetical protein [Vicinamibacterales bacterium]